MRPRPLACLAIAAVAAAPAAAHAQRVAVDAPAGSAAQAAIAIARQTGSSIVIADPAIARKTIRRIRGRMDANEAVRRLASATDARAVAVGPSAWRLVPRPQSGQRTARSPARAAPPPPALPRPAPPAPPIVVIASKRDTPRSEFPGQVSMLDGDALELGGIGGTEKITQRVATVSSTYLGSGRNKLFIRGIADSSFTGPTQATVGQYLGDLRLSYNAPDPDLRLSDLERVEVLEGPQGTLYGAGSLGGIIRIVPNMPEMDVTSGSAMIGGELVQHGEPGADANATLNLPLAPDRAALRVTLDAATRGGYIDKPALDRTDVNRTDILGGRAIVRVEIAPKWTIDLIGLGQSTRSDDSQYADRDGDPLTSSAKVREGSRADYLHGQFVISGRIGEVRLRSTTGIASQDLQERYDATPPGGPERLFVQDNDTRMIANETRLWQPLGERFGWLAGLSFTDNRTRLTRSLGAPDEQMSATGVLNTVTEATAYGEASLRVAENLIATAGARYTHSRLGGAGEDVPFALAAARAEVTASRTETAFLPSASLLASVGPETALYLRYQEGFRPGGLAIEGEFVRRFRSDHATTFEFGARHGAPGLGPFDFSASLSHTRWSDIQADFIDDLGLPSTANIGDGRVWTASVSGGVELTPELRVSGGMTYNDSRVDEPNFITLARATHVPNIAGFAARLGADYRTWLDNGLELKAHGWASYVGKSRLGIGPELGDLQGDYLDSGLTVRVGRERFGVSLSLTNLADVKGNRFALGTPFAMGRDQVTPLQPRTIRLGLDARF
jgi:outer membrane receptor protein involved in Fe transport